MYELPQSSLVEHPESVARLQMNWQKVETKWKVFWWINRLSPSWMMSVAQQEYKKYSASIHE